jgi:hypothetical protein
MTAIRTGGDFEPVASILSFPTDLPRRIEPLKMAESFEDIENDIKSNGLSPGLEITADF